MSQAADSAWLGPLQYQSVPRQVTLASLGTAILMTVCFKGPSDPVTNLPSMPLLLATRMFVSVKPRYACHEAGVRLEFVIAKLQRGPFSISPIALVRVQREPVGPSERILRTGFGEGPDEVIQQKAPTNTTPMTPMTPMQ